MHCAVQNVENWCSLGGTPTNHGYLICEEVTHKMKDCGKSTQDWGFWTQSSEFRTRKEFLFFILLVFEHVGSGRLGAK